MTEYTVGEARTIYAEFTDSSGDPVNPTVTLSIRDPADDVTTPVPSNPETGRFEHLLTFDLPGIWYVEWLGVTAEGSKICTENYCVVESSVLVST